MSPANLENRLERLLSETVESVRDREDHELERKIGSLDDDFILFGAGNLGRRALTTLKRNGRAPVAFMDNNSSLWGKELDGIPIVSPADAAERFNPREVGVITTIWYGEAKDRMSDRLGPLRKLGFEKIALFGHLAWKFPDQFLPYYSLDKPSKVIEQATNVRRAFGLLTDRSSRELFVDHVEWRLFLDYDLLPPASHDEIYFSSKFFSNSKSEVLYDIGAYTGDSVESFLASKRGDAFSQIHSFEPSPDNFVKLEHYVASMGVANGKIYVHRLALGDNNSVIGVEAAHGPASRVGRGSETVQMTTIDDFAKATASPTFLKIDIEGFEPQCLEGAKETIAHRGPVVAVCVYHMQSHLWDILLQLHSYNPQYQFTFCPHVADGWDLVLYAVPKNRLPA
jgi:FkbM family methyltransferase